MACEWLTMTYPQYLYKNEGGFSRNQLERLAQARVSVAGLGAFAGGAVALSQLGVACGAGGFLRIADPDVFERHNANRQLFATQSNSGRNKTAVVEGWIRDLVPECHVEPFADGVTLDNLERFVEGAQVVVDAVDFLRPDVKLELHRQARRKGIPVVTGLLVNKGAVLYCFTHDGPDFEEFFAFPQDPDLRRTWLMPASRILPHPVVCPDGDGPAQSNRSARMHGFEVLTGRLPITSNPFAAATSHVLLGNTVANLILGVPVPRIPVMGYCDYSLLAMGTIDLGPALKEQQESLWTRMAPFYDEALAARADYGEQRDRAVGDLQGCAKVLDGGTGTGLMAEALARQGVEVFGVERNLAMLAHALRRSAGTFAVSEGDVEDLMFPDQYFDGYLSNDVVLQADLEKTLREAHRVLKPGGVLVVSSSQCAAPAASVESLLALGVEPSTAQEFYQSPRLHSAEAVGILLTRLGFSSIETREVCGGLRFYLVARR